MRASVLFIAFLFVPCLWADEAVSALSDLGALGYETRETASRNLLEQGRRDPDRILALLPGHPADLEVQCRVDELRTILLRERFLKRTGLQEAPFREPVEAFLDVPSDASMHALLTELGGPSRSTRVLVALLDHPDPAVRMASATQLGPLQDPSLALSLDPLLADKDPGVRRAAAQSLGFLGNPDSIPGLLGRAKDGGEEREVRVAALYALGELKAREALPFLLERAKDGGEEREVRVAALHVLGESGAPEALPFLRDCLKAESDFRFDAVAALREMHTLEATKVLIRFEDPQMKESRLHPALSDLILEHERGKGPPQISRWKARRKK